MILKYVKYPRKYIIEPLLYNLYKNLVNDNDKRNFVKKENIEVENFHKLFGDYFMSSNQTAKNFIKFAKDLSDDNKEILFKNIYRTIVLYSLSEKVELEDLLDLDEKQQRVDASNFVGKVMQVDDYYQLADYKLPVNFFLSEIFFDRMGLKNIDPALISDKDIIDAGACLGDSALILSEYTNKNVYAFEPLLSNYNLLLKTIELNNRKNIIPVNLGLGDKESRAYMTYYPENIGAAGVSQETTANEASIVTLDDYVEKHDINVGLIKADIEGFEQNMLKGARKTIEKFKPVLLICIYHNPDDFFNIKPLIESWNLGYKFKYIPATYMNSFIAESMLLAYVE